MRLHWRKLISPLPVGIIADTFSIGCGSPCQLSPLRSGTPSGLKLCRSYAYYHGLCEFTCSQSCCVWKALFPWCAPPLAFSIFLPPHSRLSPEGRDLMETSPKVSCLYTVSCRPLHSSPLLQEQASLMMAEGGASMGIANVIRSPCITH